MMDEHTVIDDYLRRMEKAGEDAALHAWLDFEARIAASALVAGVRPSAAAYIVPLAAEAFGLR